MKLTAAQYEKIAASTFLVTGGAGFIGSHIAEYLLNAGARKVRVLDNMASGHFRNMAPFANHPHFEFVEGDIRNVDACRIACKGINYVVQEAPLGAITISVKDPILSGSEDASGFLNLLVAAYEAKVNRFVYASSSCLYGNNDEASKTGKKTVEPLSSISAPQYIEEQYAALFTRLYGMETIGLRYFNVFGQRHDPQSEYAADIPKFVMQFMRHESPIINETNEYVSNYTYVENVVEANVLALLTTDPNAVNQVYNIGVEERTPLDQLAMHLREFLSAFDISINTVQLTQKHTLNDSTHPIAFIDKARTLLGYNPSYSLRNGLLKSISWYWAYLPLYNKEIQEKTHQRQFANALSI
ncbi:MULTISPECIES: NAD-dependent epimerase/dehydratase family protein [Niastella]|uniref:NAD-dependent epimerase/dehydratase family protein n=1 Tax=Niastella soli TaxID=2821487 RepID=A0ABS3YRJ4_9BACT|nr:NAD-dependent epimerase/dehydratase family protein [Niastella soli]MBO9200505.1 NAD-dependent epimerase/dehydratase family protein [Niastella soli]